MIRSCAALAAAVVVVTALSGDAFAQARPQSGQSQPQPKPPQPPPPPTYTPPPTPVAPPPTVAAANTVTLAVSGVTVTLPPTWRARVFTGSDGKSSDVIERAYPAQPYLFVMLNVIQACDLGNVPGTFAYTPAYLPDGWGGRAVESAGTDGTESATFCTSTSHGWVIAAIGYTGPIHSADVMEARPVIASLLVSLSPPTPVSTAPTSTTEGDTTSAPSEPSSGKGRDLVSSLDFFVTQVTPALAELDKPLGAGVALNGFGITQGHGETVGGAWDVGLGLGFGPKGYIPYDGHLGVGFAIAVDRLVLAPLVGVGFDGFGGDQVKLKAGGYWYFGGQARIGLDVFGLVVGAEFLRRAPDEVTKETRIFGRLQFRKFSIGAQYTDYIGQDTSVAKAITGLVGFDFK